MRHPLRYNLNRTLGCLRFYDLAHFQVLDPIFLTTFINHVSAEAQNNTQVH
jgi:hypothetical protein